MQTRLVEAEARLVQAQADVVAGKAALEAQRAVVKDLVVSLYQQGDPTLVSLSGYLGAQTPSDLIRHEEYADSAAAKQSGIFDDLIAAEVLLRVREGEVEDARDDVADRRARGRRQPGRRCSSSPSRRLPPSRTSPCWSRTAGSSSSRRARPGSGDLKSSRS